MQTLWYSVTPQLSYAAAAIRRPAPRPSAESKFMSNAEAKKVTLNLVESDHGSVSSDEMDVCVPDSKVPSSPGQVDREHGKVNNVIRTPQESSDEGEENQDVFEYPFGFPESEVGTEYFNEVFG